MPDKSIEAFRRRVEDDANAKKQMGEASKRNKRMLKVKSQQSWRLKMQLTQRYLGLRPPPPMKLPERTHQEDSGAIARYPPEKSVVFICVDVEAYEKDQSKILEIGISSLDANQLSPVAPGKDGANWMGLINSRHFRIQDYAHLRNANFVEGCPDRFDFGESEWISKLSVPLALGEIFKVPVDDEASADGEVAAEEPRPFGAQRPLRNIILVGHDVKNDIKYLEKLHFNPTTTDSFRGIIDTKELWSALHRDHATRALQNMLTDLGIAGWNLHNAGNDARYTLQVMIALAFRDLEPKDQTQAKATEKIKALVDSYRMKLWQEEEGWSSEDEKLTQKHEGSRESSADSETQPAGPMPHALFSDGPSNNAPGFFHPGGVPSAPSLPAIAPPPFFPLGLMAYRGRGQPLAHSLMPFGTGVPIGPPTHPLAPPAPMPGFPGSATHFAGVNEQLGNLSLRGRGNVSRPWPGRGPGRGRGRGRGRGHSRGRARGQQATVTFGAFPSE